MYKIKSNEMFEFVDKVRGVREKIKIVRKMLMEKRLNEINKIFNQEYIDKNKLYFRSIKLQLGSGNDKFTYCEDYDDELVKLFELSLGYHHFELCILLLNNFNFNKKNNKNIVNIVYKFYKKYNCRYSGFYNLINVIEINEYLCEKQIILIIESCNDELFEIYFDIISLINYGVIPNSKKTLIHKIFLKIFKTNVNQHYRLCHIIRLLNEYHIKFNDNQSRDIVMKCESSKYYDIISYVLDPKYETISKILELDDKELLNHIFDKNIVKNRDYENINIKNLIKYICDKRCKIYFKKIWENEYIIDHRKDIVVMILKHKNCNIFVQLLKNLFGEMKDNKGLDLNKLLISLIITENIEIVRKFEESFGIFNYVNFHILVFDMIMEYVEIKEKENKDIDFNEITEKLDNIGNLLDIDPYDYLDKDVIFYFTSTGIKRKPECKEIYEYYIKHLDIKFDSDLLKPDGWKVYII